MTGNNSATPGTRLRVHLNLHRGDFSITDPRTNRVVQNADTVTLTDVVFRIQVGMLKRIREHYKRRKVCAYAVGTLVSTNKAIDITGMTRVTFNPFRDDTFINEHGEPVHNHAGEVHFVGRYCYIR